MALGQDGQLKGFAVLEYESPELAEQVQRSTDGLLLAGNHVRVSFCAPGPPGRSMLAALIAAQATVRLPVPSVPPHPSLRVRPSASVPPPPSSILPSSPSFPPPPPILPLSASNPHPGEPLNPLFPPVAALQALNRGKGLLPEPSLLQILGSLGNPASLQLLLNPLLHGALGGKQGKTHTPPPAHPGVSGQAAVP